MSDNNSGSMTAIVAIIAIIVIAAVGYFAIQKFMVEDGPSIEVELPGNAE